MSWEVIIPFLRPIEGLLRDPEVSDILVNGPANVFVERARPNARVDRSQFEREVLADCCAQYRPGARRRYQPGESASRFPAPRRLAGGRGATSVLGDRDRSGDPENSTVNAIPWPNWFARGP